jgi:hypothetical protein
MRINKVHCLFEQSGTFKNAFRNLGIEAEDYDISNDFGQTDHQIDIFAEIDKAYDGKPSIFDSVEACDLILAFFPCTRFECKIPLNFRGEASQQKNWSDLQKLEYSMQLHEELHRLYILLCKLFQISLRGGYRMVVENPYTQPHYLTSYFPIKPKVIIKDRHKEGDYFKKPTQFFFVNCDPEQNVVLQPIEFVPLTTTDKCYIGIEGDETRQVKRSLMHPQFADRFIKAYLLDKDDKIWI